MYKGKKVLAIIPARGGSKGILKKNIRNFAGKPLIAWTILEANCSKYIDRCIVSTDDEDICKVAKSYGGYVPFLRPAELAEDDTASIDVVLHVLEKLPKYDYAVLLQPTSPLRTADDIDGAIACCIDNYSESCVSVMETEHSPYWMYTLSVDNKLEPIMEHIEAGYQRQKLPQIFRLNGAVYVNSCLALKREQRFVWEKTIAYVMPRERSIDIDALIDFELAELLIMKRKNG